MDSEIKVALFTALVCVLLGFTLSPGAQQAFATTVIITDVPSCEAAGRNFRADRNECIFSPNLTIPLGDNWNVSNLLFGVRNLILEGQVTAQDGMDVDFMTNRGTIAVSLELISIGADNFWFNDCGATINLLPNTVFTFDGDGTNHGVINGDATNEINPGSLPSNTIFNSGFIDPDIVLRNVVIEEISSPCPQAVGGTLVPINTTTLLLAGVQSISVWLIPVVAAGVAIGIFVIKRRK